MYLDSPGKICLVGPLEFSSTRTLCSLFTLSILLHRMPGNLRPFVPFPFDRKVSSSWAGWTDGATRQRVNCLSGYSQRLARAHTHIYIYIRDV